jgi:hypothetical protein
MHRSTLILAAFLTVGLILPTANASRGSEDTPGCGPPVDGVQLCLASAGSNLRLVFQNIGNRDVTLNLGIMMANGKVQLPTNVAINFTDAQGKSRLFKFGDKRYPAVAGRLDDYVVPLGAGSAYSLQLTLDQFSCDETNEFSIPLSRGKNLLTARFEGTGARTANLDMPGMKLMNFWLGKVESNRLMIER